MESGQPTEPQRPPAQDRFMCNIDDLIDIVKKRLTETAERGYDVLSPTLIAFAGRVITNLSPHKVIGIFISNSHMHWSRIRERNEEFFLENAAGIFKDLPLSESIDAFQRLFRLRDENGELVLSQEHRDELWDAFTALVRISINYIHDERLYTADGYKYEFFPEIDLEKEAKLWNVKLNYKV